MLTYRLEDIWYRKQNPKVEVRPLVALINPRKDRKKRKKSERNHIEGGRKE